MNGPGERLMSCMTPLMALGIRAVVEEAAGVRRPHYRIRDAVPSISDHHQCSNNHCQPRTATYSYPSGGK